MVITLSYSRENTIMLTCQGTRQQSSTFTKHKITAQQEGQEAVVVVEEVEEEAVGECAGVALRSCTHREMPRIVSRSYRVTSYRILLPSSPRCKILPSQPDPLPHRTAPFLIHCLPPLLSHTSAAITVLPQLFLPQLLVGRWLRTSPSVFRVINCVSIYRTGHGPFMG